MKVSGFGRFVSSAAVAAILAGCGGPQVGVNAPQDVTSRAVTAAGDAAEWLYASGIGGPGIVLFAYRFPDGKFVRQFGEFIDVVIPMCVDPAGHLFVLSIGGVIEYKAGGGRPIETLKRVYGRSDCSVDSVTGDLAVTGQFARRGGVVTIYKGAAGRPRYYFDPRVRRFVSGAYDAGGNLFLDGYTPFNTNVLAELPRGRSRFVNIPVVPALPKVGYMRWDGADFAIGDGRDALVWRVSVSGERAHIIGATHLGRCRFTDFVILGDSLAAACGGVAIFDYPGGGTRKFLRDLRPGILTLAIGK